MHRLLFLIGFVALVVPAYPAAVAAQSLIQVNPRALVSRADLVFEQPATRPEEGMPVGNGRMGSLIWTTPSALRLQINRVDVHAMDGTTVSFPRADSDYGSVCGYVDINLVDAGDDVFIGGSFRQHLSLYDALMTAQGSGVTAQALAWPSKDVIAIEVHDERSQPAAINIDLRMLRYQIQYHNGQNYELRRNNAVMFRTAAHTRHVDAWRPRRANHADARVPRGGLLRLLGSGHCRRRSFFARTVSERVDGSALRGAGNHTNSGESAWNSRDAPYEISCMHMIFPLAIRASQVLGLDADLRPVWQEIKDHLVPMPARGRCGTGSEIADDRPYGAFVYNGPGATEPIGPEPELKSRFLGFTRLGSFIDEKGIGGARIFRNRLRLREGPGAIDAEHIAGLSAGLHQTMLNSRPDSVTNEEPIAIFNRWPKDWDAAFRLAARGGFIISSAQMNGVIPLVEIVSQVGGQCRLANPWRGDVTLYRNNRKAEDLSGDTLAISTAKGETVVVVPRGSTPAPVKIL